MRYKVTVYIKMPEDRTLTPKIARFWEREKLTSNRDRVFRELAFDSEAALYHYVRGFDYTGQDGQKGNPVLDAIMTAPGDSQRHKNLFDDSRYNRKRLESYGSESRALEYYYLGYLIKDETGRTVDLRHYEKELYKFDYVGSVRALREMRYLELDERWARWKQKYDRDCWLRGGDKTWGFRNMRTTQERRYACDREHKPFIRGKRGHLPDAWGAEKKICGEKTWKARTKVKRQWRVNWPSHVDTVFYEKRVYDTELLLG